MCYDQHIIIDFEFNPVSTEYPEVKRAALHKEIIEIGAVKLDKNNNIIDKFTCLIKPEYNNSIAPFVRSLTGITMSSLAGEDTFNVAINKFFNWIGTEKKTRFVCWDNTDLMQLRSECRYKGISEMTYKSVDLQEIYPKAMDIATPHKLSLKDAADFYGLRFSSKKAHRALYDAEITTELLIPILSGEYRAQRSLLTEAKRETGFTFGDLCNGLFSAVAFG